jgi:hypothetical protein
MCGIRVFGKIILLFTGKFLVIISLINCFGYFFRALKCIHELQTSVLFMNKSVKEEREKIYGN